MRAKSPDFEARLKKFKEQLAQDNLASIQMGNAAHPTSQPQSQPSNLSQDDYQNLQQQRFANPKNPYLAVNQTKEKEFVDDNFDYDDGKSTN